MKNLLISLMMVALLIFACNVSVTQASANTNTITTQHHAKELKLSKDDKMILGVCGGIGEYFGIDPDVVRIGFVILSVAFGVGIITYLIAYLFMS